jgi:hypothetical protein
MLYESCSSRGLLLQSGAVVRPTPARNALTDNGCDVPGELKQSAIGASGADHEDLGSRSWYTQRHRHRPGPEALQSLTHTHMHAHHTRTVVGYEHHRDYNQLHNRRKPACATIAESLDVCNTAWGPSIKRFGNLSCLKRDHCRVEVGGRGRQYCIDTRPGRISRALGQVRKMLAFTIRQCEPFVPGLCPKLPRARIRRSNYAVLFTAQLRTTAKIMEQQKGTAFAPWCWMNGRGVVCLQTARRPLNQTNIPPILANTVLARPPTHRPACRGKGRMHNERAKQPKAQHKL